VLHESRHAMSRCSQLIMLRHKVDRLTDERRAEARGDARRPLPVSKCHRAVASKRTTLKEAVHMQITTIGLDIAKHVFPGSRD
jgi:hypothetical protein